MKNVFFIFLLAAIQGLAQQPASRIDYSLDFPRPDSFYIVRTETTLKAGRADSVIVSEYIESAEQFRQRVSDLEAERFRLQQQLAQYQKQKESLDAQVVNLKALGTRYLALTFPEVNPTIDPEPIIEPIGFWVVYPTKGTKIQYLKSLRDVKKKGLILNPNGTTLEIQNGILK